jgi:GH43 family beta-xylosidase
MITIKNYNGDMNYGVFFGWDMKFAMEDSAFYSFEFEHRVEGKRVYVLVHRNASLDGFHEVYLQDMKDQWKKTVHLAPNHLNKSNFYNFVESVIDDEYPLPF